MYSAIIIGVSWLTILTTLVDPVIGEEKAVENFSMGSQVISFYHAAQDGVYVEGIGR